MQRVVFFTYGVLCHALFLAVYIWMAVFIGNLGFGWVPTMDGRPDGPLFEAVTVNVSLALLFALQHSGMARPAFKRWWTRYIPAPIERSTYVLASCVVTILLLWQWRPMGGIVWDVSSPLGRWMLHGLFAIGWLAVPAVTMLINHFDLFGTRQVWLHLRGQEYTDLPFRTPGAYRVVRHPLYVGWMLAFWATPTMTVAHFLFAALMTLYMIAAIPLEERDLIAHFGDRYRRYRKETGTLIPRLARVVETSRSDMGIN